MISPMKDVFRPVFLVVSALVAVGVLLVPDFPVLANGEVRETWPRLEAIPVLPASLSPATGIPLLVCAQVVPAARGGYICREKSLCLAGAGMQVCDLCLINSGRDRCN